MKMKLLRDIMNSEVATVRMDDSLESVSNRQNIQDDCCIIVVENDSIVGVVPTASLKRGKAPQNGRTILDIMKLQSTTARPNQTIRDGFLIMRKHGLTCLPIAERGQIHGIVTFGVLKKYMKPR